MVDYDILPEIELRLHSLIKDIHKSMDELLKVKDELPEDASNEEEVKEKNEEEEDQRDIV